MPDTTLNLTQPHGGEGPEPYTIDITGAEPDGWFVLEVTVDDEQAERWGRVQQQWFAVQEEMEQAFQAAKKVVEEREAAEEAEARRVEEIEIAEAQAAQERREVELDEMHGPREWGIVSKPIYHRKSRTGETHRRVHKVSCPSFKQNQHRPYTADNGSTSIDRIVRKTEAVKELMEPSKLEYGFRQVFTVACQRCAATELNEAVKERRRADEVRLDELEAQERKDHERFMNQANAPDFI